VGRFSHTGFFYLFDEKNTVIVSSSMFRLLGVYLDR